MTKLGEGVPETPLERKNQAKPPPKNRSRGPPSLSRRAKRGGLYFGFFGYF